MGILGSLRSWLGKVEHAVKTVPGKIVHGAKTFIGKIDHVVNKLETSAVGDKLKQMMQENPVLRDAASAYRFGRQMVNLSDDVVGGKLPFSSAMKEAELAWSNR